MVEAQHRIEGRGDFGRSPMEPSPTRTIRSQLSDRITRMLAQEPLSMYELLQRLEGQDYRSVLQAWGDLRAQVALIPDDRGRYRLP
jgi:hypothetical protein